MKLARAIFQLPKALGYLSRHPRSKGGTRTRKPALPVLAVLLFGGAHSTAAVGQISGGLPPVQRNEAPLPARAPVPGAVVPEILAPGLVLARTMEAIYGNYDRAKGGSAWTAKATGDTSQFDGRRVFVRPYLTSLYREGSKQRLLLATHTQDVEDGKIVGLGQGCHACQTLIGLFVFELKDDETWKVVTADRATLAGGQWGAPPIKATPTGSYESPALRIQDGGMNMGVVWNVTVEAQLIDGKWAIKEISRSSEGLR